MKKRIARVLYRLADWLNPIPTQQERHTAALLNLSPAARAGYEALREALVNAHAREDFVDNPDGSQTITDLSKDVSDGPPYVIGKDVHLGERECLCGTCQAIAYARGEYPTIREAPGPGWRELAEGSPNA